MTLMSMMTSISSLLLIILLAMSSWLMSTKLQFGRAAASFLLGQSEAFSLPALSY